MNNLVYIDTETTGLNPDIHDLIEVAWAGGAGDIENYVFPHTLANADPVALTINHYFDRPDLMRTKGYTDVGLEPISRIVAVLHAATLVGSNPSFDANFLRKKLGVQAWHHRMIDVTTCAMWEFGWDRPKGLADVAKSLRENGYTITEPDHTAASDVAATRDCYRALLEMRGNR